MQQIPVSVNFFLNRSQPKKNGECLIKMVVYQNPHKVPYGTKFHLNEEDWERLHASKLRDERLKEIQKKLSALKTSAEKVIEKIVPFSFRAC